MPTADELRQAVGDLSTLAAADLRTLWAEVDNAREAEAALRDVLPDLLATYTIASATVAADWYDELRDELNIDGRFRAIVPEQGDLGTDELAGWAVTPLFGAEPDWERARTLAEGGIQLRIANAARNTITRSSIADPQAIGWQRSAAGGCPFCVMLASRGAVYTRETVDFAAHDHCKCVAVPVFGGQELPVKPYTPTSRKITDADRARVRRWIARNLRA